MLREWFISDTAESMARRASAGAFPNVFGTLHTSSGDASNSVAMFSPSIIFFIPQNREKTNTSHEKKNAPRKGAKGKNTVKKFKPFLCDVEPPALGNKKVERPAQRVHLVIVHRVWKCVQLIHKGHVPIPPNNVHISGVDL